jgi:uncharacterized repeat protein (TIGR02543 family)
MKRTISMLLALVLVFSLCIPALAAGEQYTISVLADGKSQTTVALGDVITVTLHLTKNDAATFTLYSMQDYVCFDPDYLQYVDDSIEVYTEVSGEQKTQLLTATPRALYDYGTGEDNRVFINRTTTSNGKTLDSGVTLLTFQLKAVKQGTTAITHKTVEVFQYSGSPYTVAEQTASVTIGKKLQTVKATFSGGTEATGSTAVISTTEGSKVTLPANGFTRTGYTFAGWSDGKTTYQPGAAYTLSGNVTFTAVWDQDSTGDQSGDSSGDNSGDKSGGEANNDNHNDDNKNNGANNSTNNGENQSSSNNNVPNTSGSGSGRNTTSASVSTTTSNVANTAVGGSTETVTHEDGSTTTVETAENGTVTTTHTTATGVTGETVTDQAGTVTSVSATIPAAVATAAAEKGETVSLPITVQAAQSTASAPAIAVNVASTAKSVKVEIPVTDVKPGMVAVIVNEDGTEQIVKTSSITDNGVELAVSGNTTLKIVDNTKTFADVSSTYWGNEAITFATSRTIFNGTSETTFNPTGTMTRGMLAQVLHNLETAPETVSLADFQDVDADDWYAEAVAWAADAGIVNGYGNGTFGPNDNITRQQVAVMLWRYAGQPTTASTDSINAFADAGSVSSYAQQAMAWAIENGIINGVGGNLSPDSNANRAQVATMMMRYCAILAQ